LVIFGGQDLGSFHGLFLEGGHSGDHMQPHHGTTWSKFTRPTTQDLPSRQWGEGLGNLVWQGGLEGSLGMILGLISWTFPSSVAFLGPCTAPPLDYLVQIHLANHRPFLLCNGGMPLAFYPEVLLPCGPPTSFWRSFGNILALFQKMPFKTSNHRSTVWSKSPTPIAQDLTSFAMT
jgi:hypothetical protein